MSVFFDRQWSIPQKDIVRPECEGHILSAEEEKELEVIIEDLIGSLRRRPKAVRRAVIEALGSAFCVCGGQEPRDAVGCQCQNWEW